MRRDDPKKNLLNCQKRRVADLSLKFFGSRYRFYLRFILTYGLLRRRRITARVWERFSVVINLIFIYR